MPSRQPGRNVQPYPPKGTPNPAAAPSSARPWHGAQTSGRRAYTDREAQMIVAAVNRYCTGRVNGLSPADFARLHGAGLEPRTVRAILSDYDGIDYLLVNEGDGVMFVAEPGRADEADVTTRKLQARAESELKRVARRKAWANRSGRQQQAMELGA